MRVYQYKVKIKGFEKIVSFSKRADKFEIVGKIKKLYPGTLINDIGDFDVELWSTGDEINNIIQR